MNKFKTVYEVIIDLWKCCSDHKDKNVESGKDCEEFINEMTKICDKYRSEKGTVVGQLAIDIAVPMMKYLCNEIEKEK